MIHATAAVDYGARVHDTAFVWHWTHVRERAQIHENVNIGQGCYIDHDVVVPAGCKIQNGVSIYAGVHLGENVFVGPHVAFTNDRDPRAQGEWEIVETWIEEGVSIGAGAVILCGIRIGQGARVGCGAVVVNDVPPGATVVGNPARRRGIKEDGLQRTEDLRTGDWVRWFPGEKSYWIREIVTLREKLRGQQPGHPYYRYVTPPRGADRRRHLEELVLRGIRGELLQILEIRDGLARLRWETGDVLDGNEGCLNWVDLDELKPISSEFKQLLQDLERLNRDDHEARRQEAERRHIAQI